MRESLKIKLSNFSLLSRAPPLKAVEKLEIPLKTLGQFNPLPEPTCGAVYWGEGRFTIE